MYQQARTDNRGTWSYFSHMTKDSVDTVDKLLKG